MTFRLLLSEDSKLNPSIVGEEEEEEIAAKDRRRGRRPRCLGCSAAEIFGRYSVRARSWILHGRDGPLSNSDRQLEGRALLELGETRGANVPRCKDVEPTPSRRLSFPPRNFRTSSRLDDAGLPPLSLSLSLSLTADTHTVQSKRHVPTAIMDAACIPRDPIDPPPLNFYTTRAYLWYGRLCTPGSYTFVDQNLNNAARGGRVVIKRRRHRLSAASSIFDVERMDFFFS